MTVKELGADNGPLNDVDGLDVEVADGAAPGRLMSLKLCTVEDTGEGC